MPFEDRIVEPVGGWQSWGKDHRLIEGWFAAGEQLHLEPVSEGDEPERGFGRAVRWVRSLAVK